MASKSQVPADQLNGKQTMLMQGLEPHLKALSIFASSSRLDTFKADLGCHSSDGPRGRSSSYRRQRRWTCPIARTLLGRTLLLHKDRTHKLSFLTIRCAARSLYSMAASTEVFRSVAPGSTKHSNAKLTRQRNSLVRSQPRRLSGMHRHRDSRHVCVVQSKTTAAAGAGVWIVVGGLQALCNWT